VCLGYTQKYYGILNKRLEHLRILVFIGDPGTPGFVYCMVSVTERPCSCSHQSNHRQYKKKEKFTCIYMWENTFLLIIFQSFRNIKLVFYLLPGCVLDLGPGLWWMESIKSWHWKQCTWALCSWPRPTLWQSQFLTW
jgi:hypothetical protein